MRISLDFGERHYNGINDKITFFFIILSTRNIKIELYSIENNVCMHVIDYLVHIEGTRFSFERS